MSRPPRNPRRAYDADGREIRPATISDLKALGCRTRAAECDAYHGRHLAAKRVEKEFFPLGPIIRQLLFQVLFIVLFIVGVFVAPVFMFMLIALSAVAALNRIANGMRS
jgi:hypothetical protein